VSAAETARPGAAIASDTTADALCAGLAESETFTVKLKFPLEVGVPVIKPVEATSASPAGRLPDVIDHV
jgi:hypothetical protein